MTCLFLIKNPQLWLYKIRQFILYQQKMKRSHEENRKLICLVCFEKKKHLNNISEGSKLISNIRQFFIQDFDPSNESFPYSVCSQCRKILSKVQDKENAILPVPFDFSTITATRLTRIQDFCQCLMCDKARQTITPGAAKPSSNAGRPSSNTQQILPPAKAITVCQRCRNVIGRGFSHPCNLTERRNNIQTNLQTGTFFYFTPNELSLHLLYQ